MKSFPDSALTESPTALIPLANREKTPFTSPPFCRDNSELIFFINPNKESFLSIVKDSSTFWPITFHTSSNQIFVSGHKQEMIINQLLTIGFFHTQTLVTGNTRRQSKSFNTTPDTDSHGVYGCG